MGRGKLRLQPITDEKARRKAFEKRKKGLEKAAHELSTLCGVGIGMIVCGNDSDGQPTTIWPRNQQVVAGLIESYKSRSLVHDEYAYGRNNKTYNVSDYFKDQTEKVEGELKKLRNKMREGDYYRYNCMSLEELKQFHDGLVSKIDAVRGRINLIKGQTSLFTEYSSDVLMMNPYSVVDDHQKSRVFEPSMTWNYDSLHANMDNHDTRMMMATTTMNHIGALCAQGPYSNYAYGFDDIGAQDEDFGLAGTGISNGMHSLDENLSNYAYGFGTGMTENAMKAEPLISYSAQNVEPPISYFEMM